MDHRYPEVDGLWTSSLKSHKKLGWSIEGWHFKGSLTRWHIEHCHDDCRFGCVDGVIWHGPLLREGEAPQLGGLRKRLFELEGHVFGALNQTGIVHAPGAHHLIDPTWVVGLEGVLDTGAFGQGHGKRGVTLAIRYWDNPVLVGRHRGHHPPVKPTLFSASSAGFDVTLACGIVFLEEKDVEDTHPDCKRRFAFLIIPNDPCLQSSLMDNLALFQVSAIGAFYFVHHGPRNLRRRWKLLSYKLYFHINFLRIHLK